jgi:hypothetical protein
LGRESRYVIGEMTSVILNGPVCFGAICFDK